METTVPVERSVVVHVLVGLAALSLGVLVALSLASLRRWASPIESHLRRELRFLRRSLSAESALLGGALLAALGLLALPFDWRVTLAAWASLLAAFGLLARARRRRVAAIEAQIEAMLGALARSLDAAPSLGDALAEASRALDAPLGDELRETLHELTLGRSLEEALSALATRVGSRTFSLALATIEVGRTTGGHLPVVLRSAAAALREMRRLEGVLRSKTADGRAQAVVIGLVPLPLYLGLRWMDASYFVPLETTALGQALLGLSILLWLAAILLAQRILAVDL